MQTEPPTESSTESPTESPTVHRTRVDIYAASGEGDLPGTWLGCGSLVAARLVVPHLALPQTTGLPVVCVLCDDGGEVIRGRTLGSTDGAKATAIGLETPSTRAIAHTPRIPDLEHRERLDRWTATIARHSGCSHRAPGEGSGELELQKAWYCRIWPSAPGCR